MQKIIKELISSESISNKVSELAKKISIDYVAADLVIIGVLKAAWIFTADIVREIKISFICEFVRAVSYSGTSSSGNVDLIWDVKKETVTGKDILLLDTVLDTGLTMSYILDHLKTMNPNSLEICVLVNKPQNRKIDIEAKYTGFTTPNNFLVGYGLDAEDNYRNLPYIGFLTPQ